MTSTYIFRVLLLSGWHHLVCLWGKEDKGGPGQSEGAGDDSSQNEGTKDGPSQGEGAGADWVRGREQRTVQVRTRERGWPGQGEPGDRLSQNEGAENDSGQSEGRAGSNEGAGSGQREPGDGPKIS